MMAAEAFAAEGLVGRGVVRPSGRGNALRRRCKRGDLRDGRAFSVDHLHAQGEPDGPREHTQEDGAAARFVPRRGSVTDARFRKSIIGILAVWSILGVGAADPPIIMILLPE